jgi:hypothetical protein
MRHRCDAQWNGYTGARKSGLLEMVQRRRRRTKWPVRPVGRQEVFPDAGKMPTSLTVSVKTAGQPGIALSVGRAQPCWPYAVPVVGDAGLEPTTSSV